jgi:Fe-S-cluster containining protein
MKDCNQCGKCCVKYSNGGLSASTSEIELWDVFRPKIRAHVRDGKIWMDPKSGEQLELCPWLRKAPNQDLYTCDIYYDRPEDCRSYPVAIEQMMNAKCWRLKTFLISKKRKLS